MFYQITLEDGSVVTFVAHQFSAWKRSIGLPYVYDSAERTAQLQRYIYDHGISKLRISDWTMEDL